jgi:hypothetical protein
MTDQERETGGVVLEGVVGSTAYNLSTEASDEDQLGVFVAPFAEVLGLRWSPQRETRARHDPDVVHHELGKFLRLALAANPTVTELLWLENWTTITPIGEHLVRIRGELLSERVRATYGGYAKSQMARLVARGGTFSSDTSGRTEKHGRHLRRLLFQLESILRTGALRVRLDERQRDACFLAGHLAGEEPATLAKWFDRELARLDGMPSRLPKRPNIEAAEKLLLDVRRAGIEGPG